VGRATKAVSSGITTSVVVNVVVVAIVLTVLAAAATVVVVVSVLRFRPERGNGMVSATNAASGAGILTTAVSSGIMTSLGTVSGLIILLAAATVVFVVMTALRSRPERRGSATGTNAASGVRRVLTAVSSSNTMSDSTIVVLVLVLVIVDVAVLAVIFSIKCDNQPIKEDVERLSLLRTKSCSAMTMRVVIELRW
jgi:hypothetical protein